MDDATSAITRPDAALCPRCAGEQARIYRPGAPEDRPQITSPEAAADLLVRLLQDLDREHCVTVNLDARHRLIATTTVSIGSVDHTFMSPREVFRDALHHGAGAIVIAHNHPSGDAEPSRATTSASPAGLAKLARLSASKSSTTSSSATNAGSPSPAEAPSSSEAPSTTSATTGPKR